MADDFAVRDEMPELRTLHLQPDTADADDAILEAVARGDVGPSLPVAYRALVDVLAAVHLPATAIEVAAEADAFEMFRALRAASSPRRRSFAAGRLLTPKVLLVAGAITVASATGAAAATGSLPGAAQDTAVTVLAKIGITIPGSNSHSDDHPDGPGGADESTTTTAPPTTIVAKGDTISGLATDRSTGGVDKAQAVSSSASDGHSNAGTNGPSSGTPAGPPSSLPDQAPASAAGPPSSLPAGPPSSLPAHAPSSLPAGPPSSLPAGPPSSLPAHAPSSLPAGPPSSLPAGPPSSLPAHAPSSLPAAPPSSLPPGPPSTERDSSHRP